MRPGSQESVLFVFNEGLREDVSERSAPSPPMVTLAENVVIDKRGDFVARNGFTAVTATSTDSGNPNVPAPRYLFSTGRELCAITNHDLYSRLDEKDRWAYRGAVSPGTGRARTAFRDGASYPCYDVDGSSSYALGVVDSTRRLDLDTGFTTPSGLSYEVRLARLESDDFQLVNYNTTTATYTNGYASRSVAYGENAHPLWLEGTSGPVALKGAPYTLGDVSFPSAATIASDVYYPGRSTLRIYDARGWDEETWVLAYIEHEAQEIELCKCDTTPAITSNVTIQDEAPYTRVALAVYPDDDAIFVFCVADDGEATAELLVYRYRYSTLGLVWGPITIYTADDAGYTFTNLGIEVGTSDSADRLGMVWTQSSNLGGGVNIDEPIAMSAYMDADGTNLSSVAKHFNEVTWSRPWWHDGQLYSATCSAVTHGLASDSSGNGFEYEPPNGTFPGEIFDLNLVVRWPSPEEKLNLGGWYVGAFNVGYAHSRDIGSCASVYSPSSGVYAWGNSSTSRSSVDYGRAYMAEELRVDTTKTPLATKVGESGAALIGGTMAMWFDGELTMELGQLTSPVPFGTFVEGGTGGSYSNGDEIYFTASRSTFDAAGYLHRGPPGFTVRKTFVGAGTTRTLGLGYHTGPSNRSLTRPNQVDIFRSDTGENPRLVVPPSVSVKEEPDAHGTDTFVDLFNVEDLTGRDPLYINGGELEAVHPEGARIPLVVDGRVWLGGFWRRSRVQYSKPIAPGTASEIAVAPEFNEGFSMTIEGDDEVTGLASLDRALVIFTKSAVYLNTGEGPNDDGSNPNGFSGPQRVSSDAGCIEARSVASYPEGVLFQSKAGIYQLDRGHTVRFIGDAVRDTLASYPIITSAVVVASASQVRWTIQNTAGDEGRVLIYDYRADAWMTWAIKSASDTEVVPQAAALHEDVYYLAGADGSLWKEDSAATVDAGGTEIQWRVRTGWFQGGQHGGYHRLRSVYVLGERRGNTNVTVTISTNFHPDPGGFDQTFTWSDAFLQTLPRLPDLALRLKLQSQKANAHQFTITGSGTGAGLRLSGLRFDVVLRSDAAKAARL